jgi:hypothetical protein
MRCAICNHVFLLPGELVAATDGQLVCEKAVTCGKYRICSHCEEDLARGPHEAGCPLARFQASEGGP